MRPSPIIVSPAIYDAMVRALSTAEPIVECPPQLEPTWPFWPMHGCAEPGECAGDNKRSTWPCELTYCEGCMRFMTVCNASYWAGNGAGCGDCDATRVW